MITFEYLTIDKNIEEMGFECSDLVQFLQRSRGEEGGDWLHAMRYFISKISTMYIKASLIKILIMN